MTFWTEADLQVARRILKKYTVRHFRSAVAEIAETLNREVTPHALRSVFLRNELGPPSSYCDEEVAVPPQVRVVSDPAFDAAITSLQGQPSNRVEGSPKQRASRGFAPEYDWNHPVPEGHRIKGNSSLYNAAGELEGQWVKSERDSDDPPAYAIVPEGHIVKKVSTLVDGQGKVRAQWLQAPKDEQTRWDEFWVACERHAQNYKGLAEKTVEPNLTDEETCTVYPLGDPHIGMLSWAKETGQDFDLQIAERDLTGAVDLLVERAPASEIAVLANVGDFFHAEGDDQRTPASGHKLDCDTRWAKITDVGFNVMRHLTDRLLEKHALVTVVNVPGNHDPKMARMLAMWMSAVYEKEPRVRVMDNRNPYMYLKHGKNLLGFAHGDGAKPEALPAIMAADQPEDWGTTRYRHWFTGHIHHQTRKEFPGCVIESFRTLAPRDYWHAWKGYRSGQSLSCITLHSEYGEITRSTVDIKLVRSLAAQAKKS